MFRIRCIYDDVLPINKEAIRQVQGIIYTQFPQLQEEFIRDLPEKLKNPLKHQFRSILFVAEDSRNRVQGFAFMYHEPEINFCYLDFISTSKQLTGRGIGGALYKRIRHEARDLNTIGIFFECLPDDPKLCHDPKILKQNASRLKFYEQFGARPIINTAYETPLKPGDDNPPYLVYDNLGQEGQLSCKHTRAIVRAILERKYKGICPEEYTDMVVESFKDDPVHIRKPRYIKEEQLSLKGYTVPQDKLIALVYNDKHYIHHIKERGYVESPIRIGSILKELAKTHLFDHINNRHFSERHIKGVHDERFVDYLKHISTKISPEKSIYPYVFPLRNRAKPPKELPIRAGYYCIDTFTPLNGNAYLAARRAVDCVLTASNEILKGRRLAYALIRPPGHHAEHKTFGGFCYFNSNAVAANYLSDFGKVAILDIDYHHGNGQQEIFYNRSDILTLSIHGHPRFAYPYFSGFEDEKGAGDGRGYNINFPLPETINANRYCEVLERALKAVRRFRPDFFIIALGLDTAKGDPTGSWSLRSKDFEMNGWLIGLLRFPTIVVQEGGYNTNNLGINARHFLTGLWRGMYNRP